MAKDTVWQDESVQIMKQVFSEGIEKRDARIAALEAKLDNIYNAVDGLDGLLLSDLSALSNWQDEIKKLYSAL